MAKQAVTVELFYDGVWNAVSTEVFTDEQISVSRGQTGDDGDTLRAGKIKLTFDNRTDKYRPSNPLSPLYGKVGRNTPIRVKVATVLRMVGEVISWAPDQTPDFRKAPPRGRAWVDIEASGIIGRIAGWTENLHSPFYTSNVLQYGPNITSYLPFEDPRGTLVPYQYNPDAKLSSFGNVQFGSQNRFPGSDPLADPTGGVPLSGCTVLPAAGLSGSNDGWQASWIMKCNDMPTTESDNFMQVGTVDGTTYVFDFDPPGTLFHFEAISATGVSLYAGNVDFSAANISQFMMFRIQVSASGGTVNVGISWFANGAFAGVSYAFAGTTSKIYYMGDLSTSGTSNYQRQVTWGHWLTLEGATDDLESNDRIQSFQGWTGETAADRFTRLCGEQGITCTVLGDPAATVRMGVQRTTPFSEQLREIRDTEDALIYDDRSALGLVMQTRAYRYNRATALTLDYASGNLAPPFREVLDKLGLNNRVTVSNRDGGEYTAELTTGPTGSTLAGLEKRAVDVNVDEEIFTLPALAGWWLSKGTLDVSRYTSVTVDLDASPGLAAAAAAVEIGDIIMVTSFRPDRIPLQVLGMSEPIGSHRRKITFNTVPAELFQTAVYDSTARRYDSKTSTLNAGYSATASPMVVRFTDLRDAWSTTAAPYDWVVAGERVTVTAMGAVTGSGPWTQSATVTRSVNGISKAQLSGATVHMHPDQLARYALKTHT